MAQVAEDAATRALQKYTASVSLPAPEATKADRYLTKKEVCEMLGVTLPTLYRWDKSGYLPGIRFGRKVRYRLSEVELIGKRS